MSFSDVFPANNLPVSSAPWGRKIEDLARENSYTLASATTAAVGDNRAIAGQMGALGRQISELQARETLSLPRGSALSVTSTSTVSFATSTWAPTLPGGDGNRSSIINFYSPVTQDANTSLFLEVFSSTQMLYSSPVQIGATTAPPSGWQPTITTSFVARVPQSGLGLTVRLSQINFIAGSLTSSLLDPIFTYTLLDRVN